jgi:alpha-tubulin suppressor-like RCC1 family protein
MMNLVPIAVAGAFTHTVAQVATGEEFTCALFVHGKVLCFGSNLYGQLGQNSAVSSMRGPETILSLLPFISFAATIDTFPIVQISAYTHVCAVFSNARVLCWV